MTWQDLVLVSLAAYRTTRLLGWDVITRPWRQRLTHRAEKQGEVYIGPGRYRPVLDEFVHCPWCLGMWVTFAWGAAWHVWPHATILVALPLAVSAIVGLIGKNLDP